MTNPSSVPLICPTCGATIEIGHPYSWCMKCGQLLPVALIEQLPNVPRALSDASVSVRGGSAFAERAPIGDIRESRGPLTLLGLVCSAVGIYFLLNPAAPVGGTSFGEYSSAIPAVANLHRLAIGQTFTRFGGRGPRACLMTLIDDADR